MVPNKVPKCIGPASMDACREYPSGGVRSTELAPLANLKVGRFSAILPTMAAVLEVLEAAETIENVASHIAAQFPHEAKRLGSVLTHIAVPVSKSEAARFLGVSDETVAAWVQRGILRAVRSKGSPKDFVDMESLVRAKRRVDDLRMRGKQHRLALHLQADMEAREFERNPEVASKIRAAVNGWKAGDKGIRLDDRYFEGGSD
jgi:excisionase family DNA binding protein